MWPRARTIQGLKLSPLLANSRAVICFGRFFCFFLLCFLFSVFVFVFVCVFFFSFLGFRFEKKRKEKKSLKESLGSAWAATHSCEFELELGDCSLETCRSLVSNLPFRGSDPSYQVFIVLCNKIYTTYCFDSGIISKRNHWIKTPWSETCAFYAPFHKACFSCLSPGGSG